MQNVCYSRHMDNQQAILALAALAQGTRLDTYKLLVRHEPDGLPAGEIARQLVVPHNTMSSHLSILTRAGPVRAGLRPGDPPAAGNGNERSGLRGSRACPCRGKPIWRARSARDVDPDAIHLAREVLRADLGRKCLAGELRQLYENPVAHRPLFAGGRCRRTARPAQRKRSTSLPPATGQRRERGWRRRSSRGLQPT